MRARSRALVAVAFGILWVAPAMPGAARAGVAVAGTRARNSSREALGTLARRLVATGHAEAELERRFSDPMIGREVSARGRIALEPPDRAALRFPSTGERIALRGDGGEWVQPQLRQMIVLPAERAALARRWWNVLLPQGADSVRAERLPDGRTLVIAGDPGTPSADSAWVTLDRSGLPVRLEIQEGGEGRTRYEFRNWRFSRAQGKAAFTLRAPFGFQRITLR